MTQGLITETELVEITGLKRHNAQAAWFKRVFGFEPARRHCGRVILTWEAFNALQKKRCGVLEQEQDRPELCL
ncbi:DUF4224 domain-containing protein [Cupriavidus sp. BIC8F]|uniref:DUF4224 domain-containing protein n=1 Tax=Cupriavidus sp. BIC8F TaxID=3079014 RepID=UPI0029169634|nr:DUF4224 domain-containing protein [Cupriavidus sp. BIC8F]